ncbi:MAG: hypothetical protein UU47_C0008G0010 [candidate division TM6 bacterium GW2011_GWE2_41_16]|nr:MAG: hypothetical protein UU47_C0008G0010 [candidate division TM6 bacterium GW2011_GWE2_41_16]
MSTAVSKKIRVGVLMGGRSRECEVSLASGRTICDHLDTSRFDVVPLFLTMDNVLYQFPYRFLHRGKTSDFLHRLDTEAQKCTWDELKTYVDIVYIALHGRYGEDGRMQGLLTMLGIPYCCSKVYASSLGMDKERQKYFLAQQGIKTPRSVCITAQEIIAENFDASIDRIKEANLGSKLIIKPRFEGSSIGISLIESIDARVDVIKALWKAASCSVSVLDGKQKIEDVLVEEYIEGMEFSCIVIEDTMNNTFMPFVPTEIERQNGFFDYAQKYMPGKAIKHTPARCDKSIQEKIQHTACQVMKALNFETLGRIDGIITKNNDIYIFDPNTLSGMTPTSFVFLQAAQDNLSHTMLINHLLETDLRKYGMIQNLTESSEKVSQARMRVGVITGGRTNEREVALESGRNVCYKLSPAKYDVTPLFLDLDLKLYRINQKQLALNSTFEISQTLDKASEQLWHTLKESFDFIFLGLHGGEGENGTIQGLLEEFDLPYNGSSITTSALCMDKYASNMFLKKRGFTVPEHILMPIDEALNLKTNISQELSKQNISYPCIVKPHDDGCSMMVAKISSDEDFVKAIESLARGNKKYAFIEEFIDGTELTVGVLGNSSGSKKPRALPASQTVRGKDILSIEEKFLIGAGENQTPALLPQIVLEKIGTTMRDAYCALDCQGYARIDCFYQTAQESPTKNERIVIIEVNTLPGLTPATCIFHQAAEIGLSPVEFLDRIIQFGIQAHRGTYIEQERIPHQLEL